MPSDYRHLTIKETVQDIYDGPHATPEKTSEGPIFLGISNLKNGRLDLSDTDHLSEKSFQDWTRRVTPQAGDIVFSYETRLGQAALIPEDLRCCLGRRMGLLRVDREKVDPRYLLYAWLNPEFQRTIQARASQGSTVNRILLTELGDYPIRVPHLPTQRRIAEILGALDDKIELNRQMNATLEAMAQTLYRHWFVDFGPFQDRPFVDSDLGPIPEGWAVKTIGDVVKMRGGSTPRTSTDEYWDGGNITWFTPTDLTSAGRMYVTESDRQITEAGLNSCSTNYIPPYSLMMTSRATVGVVAFNRVRACTNQGFINIMPKEDVSRFQVYFWIQQMMPEIMARADGSTYPEISQRDFKPLPILVAPPEDVEAYVERSEELFGLIENNTLESDTLAETRDYLLPKLISGEIAVDAAEEAAAESM